MTAPPPPGFPVAQPPPYEERTGINNHPYPYPYPAPGPFTAPPMKGEQTPQYGAQPYPGQSGSEGGPAPRMTAPPPPGFPVAQPPPYEERTGINNPPYPYPYPAPGPFTAPPMKGGQTPQYGTQPYPGQSGSEGGPDPVTVQTVFIQNTIVFHDRPVQMCCPSCNKIIVTHVKHTPGTLTWLTCGGLMLVGCLYGCCLIPFCINSLQDADHYCPECHALLGTYKRL